jgi:acetyl esterase/lipase
MFMLTGCSGVDILNSIVPHSGYTIHKNIAYGDNHRQHLDVYVPDNLKSPAGVIVFFYGGRWEKGSKDDYRFAGQAFASKGYITVIADYRLYPEVYFPAFMDDAAQAFAWTHANISQYGGDPAKLFVAGHSAGAYIAIMLTVNDRYLKGAGANRAWIKGAIGMAGPYDFLPFADSDIKAIFSKEKDADTQPINFVAPGLPPILLAHGDKDTEVYPKNTLHMAARLRQMGDPVTERIYPGVAHIGIALSLADGFRSKARLLADIDDFIKACSP